MASLVKRGPVYYLQHYVAGKIKRRSLYTRVYQIAKEKLRQFESAQAGGEVNPLPTRTPLAEILQKYVEHVRTARTPKSTQAGIYHLRNVLDGF